MLHDKELTMTTLRLGGFVKWLEDTYPIPTEYEITVIPHFAVFNGNCNGLATVSKKHKTAVIEINMNQKEKKVMISYAHEHCHLRQFIVEGINPTTYTPGMLCIKAEAWANVAYKKYTQEMEDKKNAKSKNK